MTIRSPKFNPRTLFALAIAAVVIGVAVWVVSDTLIESHPKLDLAPLSPTSE